MNKKIPAFAAVCALSLTAFLNVSPAFATPESPTANPVVVTNTTLVFEENSDIKISVAHENTYSWELVDSSNGELIQKGESDKSELSWSELPTGVYIINFNKGASSTQFAVTPKIETKDSYNSVSTHYGQNKKVWNLNDMKNSLKTIGVSSVRDELYWTRIEKTKGVFTFPEEYITYPQTLQSEGLDLFYIASYGNNLYGNGTRDISTKEAQLGFARYVDEVLKLHPQIKIVEMWNEYNITSFNSQCKTGACYADFLATVVPLIKQNHPDVEIVGGATAGVDRNFFKKTVESGGLNYVDSWSFHPYARSTTTLTAQLDDYNHIQDYFNGGDVSKRKPYRVSEVGWATTNANTGNSPVASEKDQAILLSRTMVALRQEQVKSTTWYAAVNDGYNQSEAEDNFGLFKAPEPNSIGYQPKLSAVSYAEQASELNGFTLDERKIVNDTEVYRFVNKSNAETKYVVFTTPPDAATTDRTPQIVPDFTKDITLNDMVGSDTFNKVEIVDYLGRSSGLVDADSETVLTANQAPVFVTVKDVEAEVEPPVVEPQPEPEVPTPTTPGNPDETVGGTGENPVVVEPETKPNPVDVVDSGVAPNPQEGVGNENTGVVGPGKVTPGTDTTKDPKAEEITEGERSKEVSATGASFSAMLLIGSVGSMLAGVGLFFMASRRRQSNM